MRELRVLPDLESLSLAVAETLAGQIGATVNRRGRCALVIEDGPTLTHGEMPYGAGVLAAQRLGATLADPRPWAAPSLAAVYGQYPHLGAVLPAMGYGDAQLADLEATIRATPCDVILCATPIDLRRLITTGRPIVRVTYALRERPEGALAGPVLTTIRRRVGAASPAPRPARAASPRGSARGSAGGSR